MGKVKQKDRQKDRVDLITKPIKPPSDPELAAIREQRIMPIIRDLTSLELSKRSSAAAVIANTIENTKFRKLLLREQIVHILLKQTISDSALESKCAGYSILQNLALEEESDFCIHLYRQNILTALEDVIQTIVQTIESQEFPISTLSKINQEIVWNITDSVIGLISSLAEAQEEILKAISKINLICNFLFGLLDIGSLPAGLFLKTLACLANLTEDNVQISKQIVAHEPWLEALKQLTRLRELDGSKAVAGCGVLHNVFSSLDWFDHNTPLEGTSDAMLIPTLVHYMSHAQTSESSPNDPSRSIEIIQMALEITAAIATTLQEALEHATRNEEEFQGFGDDTEAFVDAMVEDNGDRKDAAEEEDLDSNDEMDEDTMDADIALIASADREYEVFIDSQPTLEALIRVATLVVLKLVSTNDESLRSSALSCLNNIAWTVSSIDLEASNSNLHSMWISVSQKIWSGVVSPVLGSGTADIGLASSVTSIAWAIARGMKGQLKLQGDEFGKFIALYQASKNLQIENDHSKGVRRTRETKPFDAFQELGVKTIGVLGQLALDPAPLALNREIGIFLLTVLSGLPETTPADAVEALNQIFDIYADKDYACDQIYWADDFHKYLEKIAPNARKMAKSIDKRKNAELRERADEAVVNLTRFLNYKRKERGRS